MTILKKINLPGLVVLLIFGLLFSQRAIAQPGVDVPVESFYDELAPYGQWNQHPQYGNVWSPNADPDFQPYSSGGHWVMTEYGNTWVSDYAWGWAPFHYGRWVFDPAYGGWLWIPGNDWAPAWVSWRSGGGYYGWAPLGPGIHINVNIPAPYWTFVPQVYFTSPRWYSYCVPRPRVVNIYHTTTIINNYYGSNNRAYNYGPSRRDIERYTRQSVPVYRVDRLDRPGHSVVGNGSVGFYRPGQASANQRGYGQNGNDRFDNSSNPARPNYGNGNTSSRGSYNGPDAAGMPDRRPTYEGSNSNSPTVDRDYTNRLNRGTYGATSPTDRNGNSGNVGTPNSGNSDSPAASRFESRRGNYSPGNRVETPGAYSPGTTQPDGNGPQPGRSYERLNRQPQAPVTDQSAPGGRRDGGYQRMSEGSRSMQPQPQNPQRVQEQSQRPTGGFSRGERSNRGPR
ncbi:DUF6600 domain-containing protein [Spirosoma areae]